MSDLIERIKSGTAFTTPDEIVKQLEAQQAEIARLRELLRDARDNGLCYWEPITNRGWKSKELMVGAINAALDQKP